MNRDTNTWPLRPDPQGDGPEEGDFVMDENTTAWLRIGSAVIHITTYEGMVKAEILPASNVMAPPYTTSCRASSGGRMSMKLDNVDQLTILRMALEDYNDRQHKLAHTARTGGNIGHDWGADIDPILREKFAQGCEHRSRVALELLDKLERIELEMHA